jgi:hypothetical protein
MALFSTEQIRRFFDQGEETLSTEKDILFDRTSLEVVSGTSRYELPDYCTSIKRVTWKGYRLDPLPARDFRNIFQSATQVGRPFWYIFNNIGAATIQFFPAPGESLSTITDVWNTAGTDDWLEAAVVEFARVANQTLPFSIPSFFRRQILKYYTAAQCYSMDGSGQNTKLAKYFEEKWQIRKNDFFGWIDEIHSKSRKLIVNEITSSNYFPAAPVLPIDRFGISVDEGY